MKNKKVVRIIRVFNDGSAESIYGEQLDKFINMESQAMLILYSHNSEAIIPIEWKPFVGNNKYYDKSI